MTFLDLQNWFPFWIPFQFRVILDRIGLPAAERRGNENHSKYWSQPNCLEMTAEEKPSDNPFSDSVPAEEGLEMSPSGLESETPESNAHEHHNVVEAEVVSAESGTPTAVLAETVNPSDQVPHYVPSFRPPKITANLENISANGGAVGAVVLGIWSLIGSFITNWSIINGILGILLGIWGLTSNRKRLALIGMVLSAVSILLCLIQVSEIVGDYLTRPEDPGF